MGSLQLEKRLGEVVHNWRKDHDRLHNGQVSSVCLFVQYNARRQSCNVRSRVKNWTACPSLYR
jgi:hypothetical protein